jgi:hypothetical protein
MVAAMSEVMRAVAADEPVMIAWTAYKATAEFASTWNWAAHDKHREGSLWAAFEQGFSAATRSQSERVSRLVEALKPFARIADLDDFYIRRALPDEDDLQFPKAGERISGDGPSRVSLTYDDFQRARDALNHDGGGSGR